LTVRLLVKTAKLLSCSLSAVESTTEGANKKTGTSASRLSTVQTTAGNLVPIKPINQEAWELVCFQDKESDSTVYCNFYQFLCLILLYFLGVKY